MSYVFALYSCTTCYSLKYYDYGAEAIKPAGKKCNVHPITCHEDRGGVDV